MPLEVDDETRTSILLLLLLLRNDGPIAFCYLIKSLPPVRSLISRTGTRANDHLHGDVNRQQGKGRQESEIQSLIKQEQGMEKAELIVISIALDIRRRPCTTAHGHNHIFCTAMMNCKWRSVISVQLPPNFFWKIDFLFKRRRRKEMWNCCTWNDAWSIGE